MYLTLPQLSIQRYMMCLDKDDLYERAAWDGAAGTSRRKLLEHLQCETPVSPFCPSSHALQHSSPLSSWSPNGAWRPYSSKRDITKHLTVPIIKIPRSPHFTSTTNAALVNSLVSPRMSWRIIRMRFGG